MKYPAVAISFLVFSLVGVQTANAATSTADGNMLLSLGLYPISSSSGRAGTSYAFASRSLCLGIKGTDYITINTNGTVNIANTLYTNVGGSVSVNNTLFAKEVRVQAAPFPDYVFADDYRLMPLEELETAIKRDRHLPGVPAAETIAKDGLPVSEIVVKQMEKIEELTLHAINLQKQNNALQTQIQTTNARLQALEDRLLAQESR